VLDALADGRTEEAAATVRTLLGGTTRPHRSPECGLCFASPGRLAEHREIVHRVVAP
jgi:zinc-finger C2H2-type